MSYFKIFMIWGSACFISIIFLDSLRFKFTGHETPRHIFSTLRDWSGINLFYPLGPWIIGMAELLAVILILFLPLLLLGRDNSDLIGFVQSIGAGLALLIMLGAVGFHLFTPLGIMTPVSWDNGVAVAWSPALFISACLNAFSAVAILVLRRSEAISFLTAYTK